MFFKAETDKTRVRERSTPPEQSTPRHLNDFGTSSLKHSMHPDIPIVFSIRLSRTPHPHRRPSIVRARIEYLPNGNGNINTAERQKGHHRTHTFTNKRCGLQSTHQGDEVLIPTAPVPTPTTWAPPRSQKDVAIPPKVSQACEPMEVR